VTAGERRVSRRRRKVVLAQLPIPQPGLVPGRGNVPLAAAYLKLYAERRGLDATHDIEIFPAALANWLGDRALVEALLEREPWMVGFTCYLWNVQRTLWIAARLKERRPDLRILVGGPEITPDNDWVLQAPPVDWAAVGEGEQTFAELLEGLRDAEAPPAAIAGLAGRGGGVPAPRQPLADLDAVSSPYLEGLLDAGEEGMLFLETLRGCVFKCKFCYYPKSYDALYWASEERVVAALRHAAQRGVREVILLDPTLNQGRDFKRFVRLLERCNPERRFTYFGELRAEGLDDETAALLRAANFTEVEIGLQSTDPTAGRLMDRRTNRRAYERGVRALLDAGIRVQVDLIVGLPGDTVESVRRSLREVRDSGLYSGVQVFNLAVLPGTAFRHEAAALGLEFQPRPPYYVLRTPSLQLEDLWMLMDEAEDLFETEFDALPPLQAEAPAPPPPAPDLCGRWTLDLDRPADARQPAPAAARRTQGFELCLQGGTLAAQADACGGAVRHLLDDNPHATLQVTLEPRGEVRAAVTSALLEDLLAACYRETTYLDRFYAMQPRRLRGAKRLVVRLPAGCDAARDQAWVEAIEAHADIPQAAPQKIQPRCGDRKPS
jgi:radical SAM superfamily enzyme YgiQ (UPF0313 family)